LTRAIVYGKGDVQNNKIFVMTYDNNYTCNPSYIVEELLRQKLPVDIVWVCSPKKDADLSTFPEEVRLVKRGSYSMFEEQASAKIWIDNALNCVWYSMPKKPGQVYLNTWHGSMGIKRLSGNANWFQRAAECKAKTDYCVTNSAFEEEVFRTTFWPDTPFLKFGHARNDILFQQERHPAIREKVEAFFELEPGKKLMLYAPTFRDDGDTSCFNLDYAALKQALEQRFGGEWIILVRAHFKNRGKKAKTVESSAWLKDASVYPDMQELMAVVDSGITDYSSWAYDFVLTGRPMFLYAEDVEKYNNGRGFYYPLETTPFLIASNNEEMKQNVLSFNEQVYADKVDAFLKDKGCYETGHASEQIVEKIKEIMGFTEA
jgi:CDP-glycerol glycerophosphotransferase